MAGIRLSHSLFLTTIVSMPFQRIYRNHHCPTRFPPFASNAELRRLAMRDRLESKINRSNYCLTGGITKRSRPELLGLADSFNLREINPSPLVVPVWPDCLYPAGLFIYFNYCYFHSVDIIRSPYLQKLRDGSIRGTYKAEA